MFGLIQKLTSNHLLYWTIPLAPRAQAFGPYVNRNNAAGYLTLCLAAALGILIWVVGRSREIPLGDTRFPSPRRPTLAARLKRSVLEFLARLDAGQIVAFSLAACIVAGIVCAISRGAWIATAGAVVVTGAVALGTRRGPGPVAILAFVAGAGIALALWAGTGGSLSHRVADLFDAAQSPWAHWQESSRAVPDFWRLGSGLGTYRSRLRPLRGPSPRGLVLSRRESVPGNACGSGSAGLGPAVGDDRDRGVERVVRAPQGV